MNLEYKFDNDLLLSLKLIDKKYTIDNIINSLIYFNRRYNKKKIIYF